MNYDEQSQRTSKVLKGLKIIEPTTDVTKSYPPDDSPQARRDTIVQDQVVVYYFA